MRDVVIAGYLRTAQSRSRPNDPPRDWFHKLRADELLAKLLPEVIKRTGVKAEEIDDFIVGSSIGGTLIEKGAISLNMRLFTEPAYKHWDMVTSTNMGLTAEKLFAQRGFTKEDMDRWGTRSHH